MNLFTSKFHELYEREIDGYKKYIELQKGIIAQKEQEIAELKLAAQIREAENIQLRDQLKFSQENSLEKDKELQPFSRRQEPWTIRKQRLERDDAKTSNAQSQYLEEYWKKRNEGLINASEESNA